MVCQKYVINQNIVPNKLKKKSETYIPKSILFNNAFKKKKKRYLENTYTIMKNKT